MIKIEKIYVKIFDNKARLIFDYSINDNSSSVWFEVDAEYSQYLCTERCDAFVIGILPYAMKMGYDIISDIPITEELHYNLTEYVISTLSKHDEHLSKIKIEAPLSDDILPNAGAVGTGVSGGIDSFHSILRNYKSKYKGMNLTHLCIFNVGSFGNNQKFRQDIREKVVERGNLIAKDLNLPLVVTNSNLADKFPRNHEYTHTYSSTFAMYCLQKLWKTYFYASSYDLGCFNLENASKNDSAKYELLLFKSFSTRNLHIFSEGLEKSRFEKTEFISWSPIAQKYLHVCTDAPENDSKCSKCMRTMLALDALDRLNEFAGVFDIDYYKKNSFKFLTFLFQKHYDRDIFNEQTYIEIKRKLPFYSFIFYHLYTDIKNFIFKISYPNYKKYICIKILGINFKFKKPIKQNNRSCQKNNYKLYYFGGRKNKNAGDVFNADLMKFFKIKYHRSKKIENANLLCVGSNLDKIVNQSKYKNNEVTIVGAGFIFPQNSNEVLSRPVKTLALRGELSKARMENLLGYSLDNCTLADPGILVSKIYPQTLTKKYKLGIIPHYVDKKYFTNTNINLPTNEYKIIDIQQDVAVVTKEICECECILSSSLHGLIFADSYNIPNQRLIISNEIAGGNYKYQDYYSVYGLKYDAGIDINKVKIDSVLINKIKEDYSIQKETILTKQNLLTKIFKELGNGNV